MKVFLLYAACALFSGGKSLVFALPMTYFCFLSLRDCGENANRDSCGKSFADGFETAVHSASLISCGFLLSELLAAVCIAMRLVSPIHGNPSLSLNDAVRTALFPTVMYPLTLSVTVAAASHLRRPCSEKVSVRIRTLAPLSVIIVGAVFLRGM